MEVTVIMSAYNAEAFIAQAIQSVLDQTYKEFEFIIINDGSTDSTLSEIQNYSKRDNRIRCISHGNMGMGESLNKALRAAKNDLVVRMDADDTMFPSRIEEQVEFMRANPSVVIASCLAYYIDQNSRIIGRTYSDLVEKQSWRSYLKANEPLGLLHPGVIYRRSEILSLGGYRGKFWPAEDIDLWNRVIEKNKPVVTIPRVLMHYRIHGGSIITNKYFDSRMKFEWVRESMWCRRKGLKEPEWEEYLAKRGRRTLLQKLNWMRKAYAKYHYRTGGFDFAGKKYGSFLLRLVGAFVLQPVYVTTKIRKQWVSA